MCYKNTPANQPSPGYTVHLTQWRIFLYHAGTLRHITYQKGVVSAMHCGNSNLEHCNDVTAVYQCAN